MFPASKFDNADMASPVISSGPAFRPLGVNDEAFIDSFYRQVSLGRLNDWKAG